MASGTLKIRGTQLFIKKFFLAPGVSKMRESQRNM